ncbi:MAG: SDR family oxidoreductase [Xanthomonadales bacterium]|nr:SDR family oxidoreductase [Xanthomonadales bacterium]
MIRKGIVMKELKNKVALITGSGRGIGREIAMKLAGEGARVVVNDLDAEPAEAVVEEIVAAGSEAIACVGSVAEEDFGERFVNTAIEAFGGIDIIVNNAGYTWDNVIQKMTDEQWYAMLDVHLTAPFRILRAAQPHIKRLALAEKEQGVENFRKVVNISSVAGTCGNAGQVNYSAAKAGLRGLTKTLCKEWGRYKVNVNTVAFGFIETRLTTATAGDSTINIEGREIKVGVSEQLLQMAKAMIPVGRPGTPAEAAGAVYLFCSPESNYISGQTVVCGGGFEL